MLLEDELHAREINLQILSGMCAGLHQPTGATIADKMLFLVAAMAAEMERDLIHERTMDGLAAAAAQGRTGGRPTAVDADTLAVARARRSRGESVTSIAGHLGIGRSTLYRALHHHEQAQRAPQSAGLTPSTQASTPAEAAPPSSRACPTCGREPVSRPEALQQRADLATVWPHLDGNHVHERRHCAGCQPHGGVLSLECTRCADGPLVTGAPSDTNGQLPPEITTWLIEHHWHTSPELICPRYEAF